MKYDTQNGHLGVITFLGTAEQMGDPREAQAFFGRRIVLHRQRNCAGSSTRRRRRVETSGGLIQSRDNRNRTSASQRKAEYLPKYCSILRKGKFLVQKARKYTNRKSAGRYKTDSKSSRHIACKVSLLDAMFVADHHYLQHYQERLYFRDDEAAADFSNLPVETIDVEEMKARILVVMKQWRGEEAFMPECSIITAIKDENTDSEWQAINMGLTPQNGFTAPEFGPVRDCISFDQAKLKIKESTCESPVRLRFYKLNGSQYCKGTKVWLQEKVQQERKKIFWQQISQQ